MTQMTVTLRGGVEMPLLGFGTWQLSGRRAYDATRAALAAGYRHIDTATMYGNEAEIGRAVRDSGVARADIFVTTKIPAERRGRARDTIGASLRALGMDQVDLWLIHWPPRSGAPAMWRELIAARDAGLTRAVGVSNFSAAQIDQLDETPAVNQIPWSPFDYDPALVAELRKRDVVLEGYSPFKRSDMRNRVLADIARAHGVTPAQVILRWHIDHGFVAIPKSATPDRIKSNVGIFGFELTADELARIDSLGRA
jgi:diketogulonate reductase-like aldo/keto reductase